MDIKTVGILGAGSMGTGIAQTIAQSGYEVILYDISENALDQSIHSIQKVLNRLVEKGRITQEKKHKILSKITPTNELNEMIKPQLIIEAIIEKMDAKLEIFEQLKEICPPDTLFTSNTSTMSITKLAKVTDRESKVAGTHFFNPAPIMKLVEIIRGYYTSDETVKVLKEFVKSLGKEGIEVKKDTPGFVVNRLMLPQFREAFLVYEEGIASIEDIDKAITLGLNYPMGPFTLMDFTGIDIAYDSLVYMYSELALPNWAPPAALKRMVHSGRLGKKVGKGWYDYE